MSAAVRAAASVAAEYWRSALARDASLRGMLSDHDKRMLADLIAGASASIGDAAREAAWLEYVHFLNEANQGPIALAWAHGWRCPATDIAKGKELRARLGLGDDNRPLADACDETNEETPCAPV